MNSFKVQPMWSPNISHMKEWVTRIDNFKTHAGADVIHKACVDKMAGQLSAMRMAVDADSLDPDSFHGCLEDWVRQIEE